MKLPNITPAKRPTEWTHAVAMLGVALVLFASNRDIGALVAVASSAAPAIFTAVVEAVRGYIRRRREERDARDLEMWSQ